MLEKQIWVYWHLHLQVVVSTIHAAFSGLFGLGTLTKGIFQCNNSKWSQRHQKIWKNDTIQPLAFDLAFTTFIGLLYFSWNPWCLRSPVVCKKLFSDHYFTHITFQTRFSNLDHCASIIKVSFIFEPVHHFWGQWLFSVAALWRFRKVSLCMILLWKCPPSSH